ncbi:hypothetical protein BT69DRAFT_1336970, partial [Atractiella rhizophila]
MDSTSPLPSPSSLPLPPPDTPRPRLPIPRSSTVHPTSSSSAGASFRRSLSQHHFQQHSSSGGGAGIPRSRSGDANRPLRSGSVGASVGSLGSPPTSPRMSMSFGGFGELLSTGRKGSL